MGKEKQVSPPGNIPFNSYEEEDDEFNYDPVDYEYDDKYFGPLRVIDHEDIKIRRARRIIQNFAIPAAALVIIPLPFSDIFFLLPLQCAMVVSIGKIYGTEIKPEKVIMEIAAACGFSVLGQITTLIVANFIPLIGKLLTAPFVYGWTYGMGEVAIKYFENKEISSEELSNIYNKTSYQAKEQFNWQRKISPEEALENLKEHLSPEEYEKIKRTFYR